MEILCKFKENIILLTENDNILFDLAEYFQALFRFNETEVDLSKFDYNAFLSFRNRISNNISIPPEKDILIKIINIVSFLNISENNFRPLLPNPQLSIYNVESFLPVIHRLLKFNFGNIAKEWAIEGRLPLTMLDNSQIAYNKFKRAYRNAKCLHEYKLKVLASCHCDKCIDFKRKLRWFDPLAPFNEHNYVPCFVTRGKFFNVN